MNTQTNLNDVIAVAEDIDRHRIDYTIDSQSLRMFDTGQLGPQPGAQYKEVNGEFDPNGPAPMYLTRHALGQIAGRLDIKYGRAFFANNEDLPTHLQADILNHYLQLRDSKNLLLRQFSGEVRGVCSDRYQIMDHAWILKTAAQFLTSKDVNGNPMPGQLVPHIVIAGWRVEADTMDVKLGLKLENPGGRLRYADSPFAMGVVLRNGTVANGSVSVDAFIMRTSCTNSFRYRDKKWSIRHLITKETLAMREIAIIAALAEGFETGYELADSLIRARAQRLPNITEVIGRIVEKQGLPQELEPVINMGTEGSFTLAGLANGLTFAAQQSNNGGALDADSAGDLEALAGGLLIHNGDGHTSGDDLANALFAQAASRSHVSVEVED